MVKKQFQTLHKPSVLDRIPLTFEYDRTIKEIKHDVHIRTI